MDEMIDGLLPLCLA